MAFTDDTEDINSFALNGTFPFVEAGFDEGNGR